MLLHTKDFQLRYNGIKNNYSGCLFIVRKDIQFTVMFDDPHGRFIALHLTLHGISFVYINVYAPNSPTERIKTWKLLLQSILQCMHLTLWRDARFLLCGDFNMVDIQGDCKTTSSLISVWERETSQQILDLLNYTNLWGITGGHTIRYTFHSRSHKSAMSRMDRCYFSHVYSLSNASAMWIDATMLLSDHNPLLINLCDSHWEVNIPKNLRKIPLRLNHAWIQTSVFKSKVHNLIQQVLSLEFPACMKWETLVVSMQEVIRECGKYFTVTLAKPRVEAKRMVFYMTEKVNSRLILSEAEYMQLCDAYRCLQVIENNAIQSSKVRARYSEVNDLHASSKCFFDFLRAKRLKDTITMLEVDGLTFRDGKSIATVCTQHFQDLFAAPFKTDDVWFSSLQDALAFTPQILDTCMAVACEKGIIEEEVFIALQSLKNGKARGLDGITKEFVVAFWSSLKTLVVDVCNGIWRDQKMPYSFKLGKIKLISKVGVPKWLGDWRPITMMSIIYKIFAKIFALRLKPIIHKVVHPLQTGFINCRSIYDNIFFTQILMEHAISSNQQIVDMQIDFEKAFDRIRWDFIAIVLKKLGFGVKFSRLIYILAQDSASHVEINGRISDSFPIERSMCQGCPLSPLFYVLASSPMFYLPEAKMNSHSIHGISVFGTQQIAVGFADDTFIFAKAEHENVQNIIATLKPFSNASGLRINMKKSVLIDISARHFHSFICQGLKIEKGTIFRYLAYPFGSNVSTKDKIEWVLNRVRSKMILWHAMQWPMHTRIRIVQVFMHPYVMYYLLLLDWKKCHLHVFEGLLKNFLWNKRHNRALVLSAWEFIW
ncbi:hypothetical protein KP509_17G052100 [Ceratopteris richardii]|uniref:Reverse transcriptase domain-containing protein n=1 Tax=Ceratopteris richardii TaxID=49495 RepID=A0A8T2SUA6_CERRI|nr:hypothetical protein KP509_17G052100 [Ceratopteris richardii]